MLRKILITIGLVIAWTLLVVAVVSAEAFWFARTNVERGNFSSIENHLVARLNGAIEDRTLGSATLALVRRGEIAVQHGFGASDGETRSPVRPNETLYQMASVSKAVTAW